MFFDDGAQSLSELECQELLASANFGHVSLTIRALPVVMPVNYQYLGGSVILSIGDGPAHRAVAPGNVIALGVDTATNLDTFRAVLVIGHATEITHPAELAEAERLRLAASSGATPSHYLKLRPDIITGYRGSARPSEGPNRSAEAGT